MKLGQVYLHDGKPPSSVMQTPSIIFKNSKSTEHTALENGSANVSLSLNSFVNFISNFLDSRRKISNDKANISLPIVKPS